MGIKEENMPRCAFVFGRPGSGKTTLLNAAGWSNKKQGGDVFSFRQYDDILPLLMNELYWLDRASAINAELAPAVVPVQVQCVLPSGRRFRYENLDPKTGKFSAFAVEDKEVFAQTLEMLVERFLSAMMAWQGEFPDLTVEFAVQDGMYERVFAHTFRRMLKWLRHPNSPYFNNTFIIQVAAPAEMRQRHLLVRQNNSVDDTLRHPGPPPDVLAWFEQGAIDPAELNRIIGRASKLPSILVTQDPDKGLEFYSSVCVQLGEILSTIGRPHALTRRS
jgi:hypothetical protein